MKWLKTHKSWKYGKIIECTNEQKKRINSALLLILNSRYLEDIKILETINKTLKKVSFCTGDKCKPLIRGAYKKDIIWVCEFGKGLPSLLLHELIHAAGGNELDSESIECYFGENEKLPYTNPTKEDFTKFRKQSLSVGRNGKKSFKGKFVYYMADSGTIITRGNGKVIHARNNRFMHSYGPDKRNVFSRVRDYFKYKIWKLV